MLIIKQAQILTNKFNNLYINKQVQMAAPVVKYVIRPLEGDINTRYPQGIKLYIQATK